MSDWLLVTLLTLASYRATRLVTQDVILSGPRDQLRLWLEHRKEAKTGVTTEDWQSKLAYLVGCSWCAGIWVSAAVVAVTCLFASVPLPVLVWAAVATVVGFLAQYDKT